MKGGGAPGARGGRGTPPPAPRGRGGKHPPLPSRGGGPPRAAPGKSLNRGGEKPKSWGGGTPGRISPPGGHSPFPPGLKPPLIAPPFPQKVFLPPFLISPGFLSLGVPSPPPAPPNLKVGGPKKGKTGGKNDPPRPQKNPGNPRKGRFGGKPPGAQKRVPRETPRVWWAKTLDPPPGPWKTPRLRGEQGRPLTPLPGGKGRGTSGKRIPGATRPPFPRLFPPLFFPWERAPPFQGARPKALISRWFKPPVGLRGQGAF